MQIVTETKGLWDGVGTAISAMPPEIAAIVILALFAMVLVYSWRRATDEAKKERGRAENAAQGLSDHKLDAILSTVNATAERVVEMQTDIAVIRDRGANR